VSVGLWSAGPAPLRMDAGVDDALKLLRMRMT
jgi:hypothetical protein